MDQTQQQQQDADSEQQQQLPPPPTPTRLLPRPDLVAKPIPFLHPTRKGYEVWDANEKDGPADAANANATAAQYRWRARDNRKGRHPLVVQSRKGTEPPLSRTLARTA